MATGETSVTQPKSHIGAFARCGFFVKWAFRAALLAGPLLVIPACGGPGASGGTGGAVDPGFLRINVDPVRFEGAVGLQFHVAQVEAKITSDLSQEGEWLTISTVPDTLNLVGFPGVTPKLFTQLLVPREGFLQQLRFIITDGQVTRGPTPEPVKLPSGPETGLKAIAAGQVIEIIDQVTTDVTIRLDPDKSIIENRGQGIIIKPVVKLLLGAVTSLPIGQFVPDRVMVLFKSTATDQEVQDALAGVNATIHFKNPDSPYYVLDLPQDSDVLAVKDALAALPQVDVAAPDLIGFSASQQAQTFPNDPGFSGQWGLHNTGGSPTFGTADIDIDAPEAWAITTGNPTLIVAVLDSGIDLTHPDLTNNIWVNPGEIPGNGIDDDGNGYIDDVNGWNFVNNNGNVSPQTAHGTKVAGIIGLQGNNAQAQTGVCWNVKLMVITTTNTSDIVTASNLFNGLSYAKKMGAVVANFSAIFIDNGSNSLLYPTLLSQNIGGMLLTVAAGNQTVNIDADARYFFPAESTHPQVITVGEIDKNGAITGSSNVGASVHLCAPGQLHPVAVPGGFGFDSGTSISTPFVAGVAALVKSQFPALDAAGIRTRIFQGVDTDQRYTGYFRKGGRLNAFRALQ